MNAELILGADLVGLARDPHEYRVRFWGEPPHPGFVRTVEEWRITDFSDYDEVQRWAATRADGRDFEVFAVLIPIDVAEYVRIAGTDGDADSGASESVVFSSDI